MNIKRFADEACRLAGLMKLDDIELLLSSVRRLEARVTNRDVVLGLEEDIFTAGVRVLKNGRLGYVPVTEPSVELLETGIRAALARPAKAPFRRFATIMESPGLDARDPEVERLFESPARVRDLARDISSRGFGARKLDSLEAAINVEVEERMVATLCSASRAHLVRTGFSGFADVNSQDFDVTAGRRLPDLDKVAGLAAGLARSLPKRTSTPEAEGVKGKRVPMVIHPLMLDGIIRGLVAEHCFASTVQDGLSRYKAGDRVASRQVTLHDDGTAPWGDSTFPTDDEGTPMRRTTVIEHGVLKTLLYDRASAAKDRVESTGNGRRRPVLIEQPHEAPVRCTCNDLFLEPGDIPLRRILKGIKRGLLVKYLLGFHTANKTTGDFSNALYIGRVIRDGKAVALPEPGRWSVKGNALDLLKDIKAISRETLDTGSGRMPWVLVDLVAD